MEMTQKKLRERSESGFFLRLLETKRAHVATALQRRRSSGAAAAAPVSTHPRSRCCGCCIRCRIAVADIAWPRPHWAIYIYIY